MKMTMKLGKRRNFPRIKKTNFIVRFLFLFFSQAAGKKKTSFGKQLRIAKVSFAWIYGRITCCGHPRPGENVFIEACQRRLLEEFGILQGAYCRMSVGFIIKRAFRMAYMKMKLIMCWLVTYCLILSLPLILQKFMRIAGLVWMVTTPELADRKE